jgi:2-C-methyl-D-erythritol 4-phosphate cytidylyltransferase
VRVRALDRVLAGVVVVDRGRASTTAEGTAADTAPWEAVATVIGQLPVTAVAFLWLGDAAAPSVAAMLAMCDRLPGRDAVIAASPVSDAVKRVTGGMIVGGVDRAGLCRPRPPLLLRATTARDPVAAALAAGEDIVAALASSGCSVAVMTPEQLGVA